MDECALVFPVFDAPLPILYPSALTISTYAYAFSFPESITVVVAP